MNNFEKEKPKHRRFAPRKEAPNFDTKNLSKLLTQESKIDYSTINPDELYLLTISGYKVLDCNMSALIYKKKIILIDCGSAPELLEDVKVWTPRILSNSPRKVPKFFNLDLLLSQGYTIEAILLTHCHADHSSGLESLDAYLKSQNVDTSNLKLYTSTYHSMVTKRNNPFKNIIHIQRNSVHSIIQNSSFKFFFLNHSSHHSIAFHCKLGDKTLLFLPDHKEDHCFDSYAGENNLDINKKIRQYSANCDAVVLEGTRGYNSNNLTLPEASVDAYLLNLICSKHDLVKTIFVSTYPSNSARLASVLEAGLLTNRKVYVMGRSMQDTLDTAVKCGTLDSKYATAFKKVNDCTEINHNKKNALVLCTGHMGEENAILSKMLTNKIPTKWSEEDLVILSSTTIPKPGPIICRNHLLNNLRMRKISFYTGDEHPNLHTSGHIGDVDYVSLLKRIKDAKRIIINHSDIERSLSLPIAFQKADISLNKLLIPNNHQLVKI